VPRPTAVRSAGRPPPPNGGNPNIEIRNPKQIRTKKPEMTETKATPRAFV